MKKMINNEVIEMTAEEISQRETQIANDIAEQTTKDNSETITSSITFFRKRKRIKDL